MKKERSSLSFTRILLIQEKERERGAALALERKVGALAAAVDDVQHQVRMEGGREGGREGRVVVSSWHILLMTKYLIM